MTFPAFLLAAERHRGQTRKDGVTPYITHPVAVRRILVVEGGITDPTELQAALLHDLIEDTATTRDEIAHRFGEDTAAMVAELTNDPYWTCKHTGQLQRALGMSAGAARVKIADKIASLRDVIDAPPPYWSDARRARFVAEAVELVELLRWASPALGTAFDRDVMRARLHLH